MAALALLGGCGDEVLGEFQREAADGGDEPSDVFVAVGEDGRRVVVDVSATIVLSDVSEATPDSEATLHAVAVEGGALVATGGDLTRKTYGSWDHGLDWTVSASPDPILFDVDAEGDRFVGVGVNGTIAWTDAAQGSPVSWTTVLDGGALLRGIQAAGGGVFMAVGADGERHLSTDGGQTWDLAAIGGDELYSVAYGQGLDRWVSVGQGGRIAWTVSGTWDWAELVEGSKWQDVIWDGSHFVAVGYEEEPASGLVATSSDGENWTYLEVPMWFTSIAHHDGLYVGVDYSQNLYRSENLQDWEQVELDAGPNLIDVVFAP